MAIEYSPEQLRVLEAKSGGYIVVANAGTGKTTSIAELIVRRYLDLQAKLFPSKGNVSGKEQFRILAQFLCVTFTVKAAGELDHKIKKLFAERGIPAPLDFGGKDYRVARTLDSLVSAWLRKPSVFAAWMTMEQDTHARLEEVRSCMNPDVLRLISSSSVAAQPTSELHEFAGRWPWLSEDQVPAMLLDCVIRAQFVAELPDCSIHSWAYDFDEAISKMWLGDRNQISTDFWAKPLEAWKKHQDHFRSLDHAFKQGKKPEGDDEERIFAHVQMWERMEAAREEFQSVNELARARGYHPIYAPEKLVCRSVEMQLAACDFVNSYTVFMAIALKWHQVKTNFLIREFGDQTSAFVRACESHPEILERGKEFPRLVRRKNVFWDEVQDNSDFQHRILKLFYGKDVEFLSVAIGDPKQQIYCWRGASPRGFLDMIDKKRTNDPARLLGLTISFRSAKKIVALGNEIIQTLPSYRETVLPSSTIYEDEGEILVTKPFMTIDEEAEWVALRIQTYMEQTTSSVMVVSRADISDHPLYFRHLKNNPHFGKRISCLTIHKSKGLEADVVIALGMVAGKVPDCRSNADEEVNLFYVACTRARRTLILCGLVAAREVNEAGRVEDITVGPSPYFWKLPTLRKLCLEAGWPEQLLKKGVESHGQNLAIFISRIDKRKDALEEERMRLFPRTAVPEDLRDTARDYGAISADVAVEDMERRRLDTGGGKNKGTVPSQIHARVLKKLIEAQKMTGNVPRLGSDEFGIARRCKWIYKPENGTHFKISPNLEASAGVI